MNDPRPDATKRLSLSCEELYLDHFDSVFAFVHGRLGEREDALDLTQEVFVRFIRTNPPPGSIKGRMKSYLLGIAKHVISDFWSGRARRESASLDDAARIPDRFREPCITTVSLERCLQQLKEVDRNILDRHFAWGETHKEIATKLGLSHGQVRLRFHRALKRLNKCLGRPKA